MFEEEDAVLAVEHLDRDDHLVVVGLRLARQRRHAHGPGLRADLGVRQDELHIARAALGRQLDGGLLEETAIPQQLDGEGLAAEAVAGEGRRQRRVPADDGAARGLDGVDAHVGQDLGLVGILERGHVERRGPRSSGPGLPALARVEAVGEHDHAEDLLAADPVEEAPERGVEGCRLALGRERADLPGRHRGAEPGGEGIDFDAAAGAQPACPAGAEKRLGLLPARLVRGPVEVVGHRDRRVEQHGQARLDLLDGDPAAAGQQQHPEEQQQKKQPEPKQRPAEDDARPVVAQEGEDHESRGAGQQEQDQQGGYAVLVCPVGGHVGFRRIR